MNNITKNENGNVVNNSKFNLKTVKNTLNYVGNGLLIYSSAKIICGLKEYKPKTSLGVSICCAGISPVGIASGFLCKRIAKLI